MWYREVNEANKEEAWDVIDKISKSKEKSALALGMELLSNKKKQLQSGVEKLRYFLIEERGSYMGIMYFYSKAGTPDEVWLGGIYFTELYDTGSKEGAVLFDWLRKWERLMYYTARVVINENNQEVMENVCRRANMTVDKTQENSLPKVFSIGLTFNRGKHKNWKEAPFLLTAPTRENLKSEDEIPSDSPLLMWVKKNKE